MKSLKLTLLLGWLSLSFLSAQFSDLGSLSEGRMVYFQTVLDNDDQVYGYMAIYQLEKVNDETKKFEYIFLDKNLNTASSQEFESNRLTQYFYSYINEVDELILKPKYQILRNKDFKLKKPRSYVVDLKNNTMEVKDFVCFESNELVNCDELRSESIKEDMKKYKDERKSKGYLEQAHTRQLKDGGYLVYTYNDVGKKSKKAYASDNRFIRYDKDKNVLWEYKFNENADKRHSENYAMLEWDDDFAYFLKVVQNKNKYEYYVNAFDMDKGKKVKEVNLKDYFSEFYPSQLFYFSNGDVNNTFSNDDFFKILGIHFNYSFVGGSYQDGFATITYHKKTNEFTAEKLYYSDLKDHIDIKPNGSIDNNYMLHERDAYFLDDGSVGILTEKARYKSNGKLVTTDMVMINTDNKFNPKEVIVLDKAKTKAYGSTDYLFSQHLNDKKDVVFFYRDYEKDTKTKDKNWNLYINTIIDGKFNQESIQISSDSNFIYPSLAKEGYILLREFNENDKYDQIRLERLNY